MRSIHPLALITPALAIQSSREPVNRQDRNPNFIFIFTDDLGYGDIGCFSATDINTPNIDRMAEEGIKFTSFCSASTITS